MATYEDPDLVVVETMLRGGVSDPNKVAQKQNWTPEQKSKWVRSFNAHADYLRANDERKASEQADTEEAARSRAASVQASLPAGVRDVAGGLARGLGRLGSMGLRAGEELVDTLGRQGAPAPSRPVQDSLADVANRGLDRESEIGRARVGKECRSRWSPYH